MKVRELKELLAVCPDNADVLFLQQKGGRKPYACPLVDVSPQPHIGIVYFEGREPK